MSRIIIGIDDSERSADAIAFGGALARDSGAGVTVANAFLWQHAGFVGTHETNLFLLGESHAMLARATEPLGDLDDVDTRSLPESSAAWALQDLADDLEAGLIVVGSSHHGRLGRVFPGSTAERLLHGSSCPVAVVPHGYANTERHGIRTIVCGWDGTPEADAALGAAEELARKSSAKLRVIRTCKTPTYYAFPGDVGSGYADAIEAARDATRRELDQRLAHISADVDVNGELYDGFADRQLVEASRDADLVVLGSRGYGPLRAVLLGGVSGVIVREAHCPVIVVPSGARRAVASVVGAGSSPIAV